VIARLSLLLFVGFRSKGPHGVPPAHTVVPAEAV
jgi:hypothetical protein